MIEAAHRVGLRTTATIMFGHIETARFVGGAPAAHPRSARAHRRLHRVRSAALRAHGSAAHLKGAVRKGPTWRETLLMHAVARLVLIR